MALNVIKRKIDKKQYQSARDCLNDIHLMCQNARVYNEPGSFIVQDADAIQNEMDKAWNEKVLGTGVPGAELPSQINENPDESSQLQGIPQLVDNSNQSNQEIPPIYGGQNFGVVDPNSIYGDSSLYYQSQQQPFIEGGENFDGPSPTRIKLNVNGTNLDQEQ